MPARTTSAIHHGAAITTTPTSPRTQCAARAAGGAHRMFHIPTAPQGVATRACRGPAHQRLQADATGATTRHGCLSTARQGPITGTTLTGSCFNKMIAATSAAARFHRAPPRRPLPRRRRRRHPLPRRRRRSRPRPRRRHRPLPRRRRRRARATPSASPSLVLLTAPNRAVLGSTRR